MESLSGSFFVPDGWLCQENVTSELGYGKGTVSAHLNEVEAMLGVAVLRRPASCPGSLRTVKCAPVTGKKRLCRSSVRGWHSFRTGFITRALSAGMPEELVRRVTGH